MVSRLSIINKLILISIAIVSLAEIKLPRFSPNLEKLSNIDDWEVLEILSGSSIIVSSRNKILTVALCSIAGNYFEKRDESKKYLESLIERGKLRISFLNEDDEIFYADVFVQLKPDYQKEIYLNKEMVERGMATINSPHLCPDTVFEAR